MYVHVYRTHTEYVQVQYRCGAGGSERARERVGRSRDGEERERDTVSPNYIQASKGSPNAENKNPNASAREHILSLSFVYCIYFASLFSD